MFARYVEYFLLSLLSTPHITKAYAKREGAGLLYMYKLSSKENESPYNRDIQENEENKKGHWWK